MIVSHDQTIDAIPEYAERADAHTLRRALVAVLTVHVALPSPTGKPDPDCVSCEGTGRIERPAEACGGWDHCHCRCPWCTGCEEPVCEGPCPTVAAIAARLGVPVGQLATS